MSSKLTLAGAILALSACDQSPAPPVPRQQAGPQAALAYPKADPNPRQSARAQVLILALGDSLFAGYGLEPGQNYPAALAEALQARGIKGRIVNAGVSGDTSADGLARLDFLLNAQTGKPALVLISLGGNDMLRALPPRETRRNLAAILTRLDRAGIPAVLYGLRAAPNLGADYTRTFDAIYPELAKQHRAALVPFFVKVLVANPALVQADHIHPTWPGVQRMAAETVNTVAAALPKDAAAPF